MDAISHYLPPSLALHLLFQFQFPIFSFSPFFLLQLTSVLLAVLSTNPPCRSLLRCVTFLCRADDDHHDDSVRPPQMTTTRRTNARDSPRRVLMRQFEMLLQHSNANSGFRACINDGNIFKWRIFIDGPPETPYAGCTFTALLKFPSSFPFYPPTMTFLSDILHPNIDTSGKVCISILHPPGIDPLGYEQVAERWNHHRTVESVLVSIQLLLAEPNFNSPANVDAAVLFRSDPARYREEVRRRVEAEIARTAPTPPPGAQPPDEQGTIAQAPEEQGTTQAPEGQGTTQAPEGQGTTQAPEEQGTTQPPEGQGTTQPPATPPPPEGPQQQTGEWYI
ncbi:hypothetical protein niasHT_017519 [Heterodera trifolii]|uniref:UBC core domain-containing protein n=1 Tax=Heterodera trifolii TaxID=157864 RepID=A0ABD2L639_9BILA